MSDAIERLDEYIFHAHMRERFKTAQAQKVKRYIRKLNRHIADYLLQIKRLETRKQFRRVSAWVKTQTEAFETQLVDILEKDFRGQFQAEVEWIKETEPETETIPNEDRIVNNIFFNQFNDVYTVESYIKSLANRIHAVWDGQMRIAVTSGIDLTWVIEQVIGD